MGGGGRRTDFAWQKGCSLPSAPFPSCCPPPHCHTCSHVRCVPGNAADPAPGTSFAYSKRGKQAVYAIWKIYLLWESQAHHKIFPASPETWMAGVPWRQHPALDRRGHGALSLEIMLLPFPLPASNMRAVASVRHPIPYCATTGGWRIGPLWGGSAVKSHSTVECAALWPEPGTSTVVRKG